MAPTHISSLDFDAALERVSAGDPLSADEVVHLAESPDILAIGMLADAVRRRVAGSRVTYLRVALVGETQPTSGEALPPAARDVRLTGSPETLAGAIGRVTALKAHVGSRTITGFSWADIDRWATANSGHLSVLVALRNAGLDAVAELPLDLDGVSERQIESLIEAGFRGIRLTIDKAAPMHDRLRQVLDAARLCERFAEVTTLAPLPLQMKALRPTTGYDDVKAVALARLAMPGLPHIQVDWLRYGPKLAQVALTFGADDIDNVSALEAAPDGHRRAPVAELRRNIESAGFTAVERDGRFATLD